MESLHDFEIAQGDHEPDGCRLARSALDCGSPLPLFGPWERESARGLAQSKTLRARGQLMERAWPLSPTTLAGFTLIEVILAIGIAAGILMVVLFFYGQCESLRTQLLRENSKISAARLVMERLSGELSGARRCQTYQQGLSGGADNLQFVRLDFPLASAWTNATGSASVTGGWPFRLVSYSLGQGTNGSPSGLMRSEEALSRQSSVVSTNADSALMDAGGTATRGGGVTIEQLQFLRFRYYDGTNWLEAWSGADLPLGIEVSLGVDPLPPELTADEYPFELYRRVIALPNSPAGITSGHAATAGKEGPG